MALSATDGRDDTVTGLLLRRVEESPDSVFLDFSGERYTYADVWERASEVAGGLTAAGVRPGETVVSMTDNHIDGVAAWFGTNMIGGIWAGINTALKGDFLRHVIDDTGAAVVICEQDFVERIVAVEEHLPSVQLVLYRGEAPADITSRLTIEPLDAHRVPLRAEPIVGTPDDLSYIIYTGGTTGPSKGCMISHGYAFSLARNSLIQTGRTAEDINWNPLPMYHGNVLNMTILGSMLVGGTGAVAPRFSVSNFWPEIERTGATVVNILGSMPIMLAQQPDTPESKRCFGQIRVVYAVPFSPELQETWRNRFGVTFAGAKAYGLTEAFPLATLSPAEDCPPEASGRPNEEDFEVRVVDDNDQPVGPGDVGEVVCRPRKSNVMFKGYWGRPEATVQATKNLWFHSGDLGRIDENGFFYFVDRKQDYLRRRGENISSQEVEAVYLQHPGIEQVAVHAVRSEFSEDEVKATVVLTDDAQLSAEELFEWSKERIPYYALPRFIEFRAGLPISPVGRVRKVELRDEGCTPNTWDRDKADVSWERR